MKFSKHSFRFIIIACLCVQSVFLFALDVPPLNGPVNDYAHIFTASETQELNAYLYSIDRQSDLQIAVLTIPSLEGESLEDYSIRVAEKWQIGQKGKDSGVILIIAVQDRKLRIEVGYGLEDRITDAQSSRIIRSIIAPYFKQQEYGKGVLLGVKNLAGLALQDESLISETVKEADRQNDDSIPLPLIIFLIIRLGYDLFGSSNSSPFWYNLDRFLSPVIAKTTGLFQRKPLQYRTRLILTIILILLLRIVLGLFFGSLVFQFQVIRFM